MHRNPDDAKSSIQIGLGIGLGSGMLVGLVSGLISGDEEVKDDCGYAQALCPLNTFGSSSCTCTKTRKIEAGAKAASRSFLYGAIGGTIGYLIGSARVTIDLSKKEKSLEELTRYSYFRE